VSLPTKVASTSMVMMAIVVGGLIALFLARSSAQEAHPVLIPPRLHSPHWDHINILDFGRALPYITDPTIQGLAYEWFTAHVDAAEEHNNAAPMQKQNTTMNLFHYQLDLSTCRHHNCGWGNPPEEVPIPEDYFLHFSEDTQLRFMSLESKEVATINVPGCPSPQPISKACRVQIFLWTDSRWVFNTQHPGFQAWKADAFLQLANARKVSAIFLDEHGPGFSLSFSWGKQVHSTSGGGIREFNGKRPQNPELEKEYNTAVAGWLATLSSTLKPAGKFVLVNTAGYSLDPLAVEQILAAKGVTTELMYRPDSWPGAYQFQQFIDLVKQMTAGGGVIDLFGSGCYIGPAGYTPGNFRSSQARYRMWRLAGYYVLKEPDGSAGRVFFDPTFCGSFQPGQELEFTKEWLQAYQVDVGRPSGESYTYQQGKAVCDYIVFGRTYTKALMLVRPKDFWNCTDYGDGTAATITLPKPMRLLRGDGSLGPANTTVSIRNGEAVILMH
jgi:hypothetical protein